VSAKTAEDLIAAARVIAPGAVFSEPWETRAFAVAVALCEGGLFRWAEFQQSLIDEIAAAEKAGHTTSGGADYYHHWLDALTGLLNAKGIVGGAELQARVAIAGPPPPPQDPHEQHTHEQGLHGRDPHR
jgi:nitrile hydratase accessory protein